MRRSIEHREREVLLTYDRESVSVGTSSSQHRPGVREEHCEAAHLTAAERQHRLVRNPTDLERKDSGNA